MKKVIIPLIILTFTVTSLQAQIDSIQFPVSLSSFEAGLSNSATRLTWKTACYISYANFQIQKSSDGISFSTINSFTADRLRCQQPFTFIDSAHNTGNIFYRINAGDIDGHFYHSKIISINTKKIDLKILSVYPTLVSSNATIVLSSPYEGDIKLQLFNANGVSLKQFKVNLKRGESNFSVDLSNVSKGKYGMSFEDVKGNQQSIPVVKQ